MKRYCNIRIRHITANGDHPRYERVVIERVIISKLSLICVYDENPCDNSLQSCRKYVEVFRFLFLRDTKIPGIANCEFPRIPRIVLV